MAANKMDHETSSYGIARKWLGNMTDQSGRSRVLPSLLSLSLSLSPELDNETTGTKLAVCGLEHPHSAREEPTHSVADARIVKVDKKSCDLICCMAGRGRGYYPILEPPRPLFVL